ncbi:MAG TPA: hypothetical protein VNE82_22860 [Candidatus Binataceae bacterium]|nr:hypothetical protein [Candidatus Binataceae bacterium]
MSEYQYFEFQSIARPLTQLEMRELRSYSSRATITSTRFVNEYQWGNFKGDPKRWIEKYFDTFFYVANWGTRQLMLRLPRHLVDLKAVRRYCCADAARVWRTAEHVVFNFQSQNDEAEDWAEANAPLAALIPLRAELARGDYRCLYLAWLSCVQAGEVAAETEEPPIPAGFRALSGALCAFAEFFHIDAHLIAAAAERAPRQDGRLARKQLERSIQSLPDAKRTQLLLELIRQDPNQRQRLLTKFRDNRGPGRHSAHAERTVAQLLRAARQRAERSEARGSRTTRP